MSLLEGELAGIISDALIGADLPYAITLRRTVPGTPDPTQPWVPVAPAVTNYSCRGFEDRWSAEFISQGLVRADAKKVCVLVPTLAIEPLPGDEIISRGATLTVLKKFTDPARAIWELEAVA